MADPIKLEIAGKLPGEEIVVEIIRFMATERATMSQENRDKWDALNYAMLKGWHNWWISMGWPGEKVP